MAESVRIKSEKGMLKGEKARDYQGSQGGGILLTRKRERKGR